MAGQCRRTDGALAEAAGPGASGHWGNQTRLKRRLEQPGLATSPGFSPDPLKMDKFSIDKRRSSSHAATMKRCRTTLVFGQSTLSQ
jgi:hypothetical protein